MNRRCHCGKKLKNARMRLCGECSKYFELWGAICGKRGWRKSDDMARKAWHALAGLAAEKSHTKFAHGEFTRLFNWTRLQLAGDADLGAAMEAANPEIAERRELVKGIVSRATDAYAATVAGGKFGWKYGTVDETEDGRLATDWREMELPDLRQLSWTLAHRDRAHKKNEAIRRAEARRNGACVLDPMDRFADSDREAVYEATAPDLDGEPF